LGGLGWGEIPDKDWPGEENKVRKIEKGE